MSEAAAARSLALLRAWLVCEGVPAARADDFEQGLACLQGGLERMARPLPEASSPWLRLWSGLPAGARDLIVLRVLGGVPLARIAELQARPLALIEREWLLLGRRLSSRDPQWPVALRQAFLDAVPERSRQHSALRTALAAAAVVCLLGALFASELRYAWLLDPAQQRLQAPPAPPSPVVEHVPLSASEFDLWADEVEYSTLQSLDFLLWRLREGGGEVVQAANVVPVPAVVPVAAPEPVLERDTEAAAAVGDIEPTAVPQDLSALLPWATQWHVLPPEQQGALLQRAQHWEQLDTAARERFERRALAWRELPPTQRAELRERYVYWRGFDGATQATLRALQAGFEQATPAQQSALRAQFQALSNVARRGLLAGKTAELAELANDAFAFVPEDERERTLDLLRGLGAVEHDLLRRMARRLDPLAREMLRAELLAVDPELRPRLIRERAAAVGLRGR